MKMTNNADYEKTMQAKREAAAKFQERKFTPDLFMPKPGEQIQVQFLNATTLEQAGMGVWCHIINMTSKKGSIYELRVPCLNGNSNEGTECPLCKHKHISKNNFGQDCEESKTAFINPYVLVNMNMKWDKDKEQWVPKTDMQAIDGVNKKVELQPTLCKYLNKSSRFYKGLMEFIKSQGGDIAGKVITIQGIYVDKKGNQIATGNNTDKSYTFAINTDIKPVDVSKFEMPEIDKFFAEKTNEEMDLFINTGKWYEPKNKDANEGDVIRGEENTSQANTAQASSTPASDANKYANIPGTTFVHRED